MRKNIVVLGALIGAVLMAAPPAGAMLADVPLEIIAARSELIIVAEVLEAGQAVQLELHPPGYPRPVNTWFRRYTVKVTRTIKDARGDKKTSKDQKGAFFSRSRAPAPAGGFRPQVSDDLFHRNLPVGYKCVLILKAMASKNELFLPSYPKNCRQSDAKSIAVVEAAADSSKWPWGKAHAGLQIAMVPRRTTVVLRKVKTAGRPVRQAAFIQGVVALKNVSKNAITINTYPEDKFLSVTAVGSSGELSADLYSYLVRADLPAVDTVKGHSTKIEPGTIAFIAPHGSGDFGLGFNMDLAPGKWKLKASYASESTRTIKDQKDVKLWTGKIASAAVEIEVKTGALKFKIRPLRRADPAQPVKDLNVED